MNILVTGCSGFVGSATVKRLIADGHVVVGIDRNTETGMNGFRVENEFGGIPNYCLWNIDITDSNDSQELEDIFQSWDFDSVVHLAAVPGVRDSISDPVKYYQNNLMGTLNILELMRKFKIPKLVFASTSSVYDWQNAPYKPLSEMTSYVKPGHPYAGSKLACEDLCRIYHELHGLDVSVLRYHTIYGPAGRPDMLPMRVVRRMDEQEPIHLNGDGLQERDFTYIDDAVDANIKAFKPIGFEVFNIGSGSPYSLIEFINRVQEANDPNYSPAYKLHLSNSLDARFTWADNSKAWDILDWEPETTLQAGIGKTVDWYRDNRKALKDIKF